MARLKASRRREVFDPEQHQEALARDWYGVTSGLVNYMIILTERYNIDRHQAKDMMAELSDRVDKTYINNENQEELRWQD